MGYRLLSGIQNGFILKLSLWKLSLWKKYCSACHILIMNVIEYLSTIANEEDKWREWGKIIICW